MARGQSKPDLEFILKEWAWDRFAKKANKKEKKLLNNEDVSLALDWSRVKFIYETKYEPEPPEIGKGQITSKILFNTTFTNRTDKRQTYSFRTERATKSTLTTTIDQGYTNGVDMSVKLSLPSQILEANAGFHREITLTKSEGETLEEELRWSVDCQVDVTEGHLAEASMNISEEEYTGKFIIKTTIKGRIRAIFTNLKDNNSFIKSREGDVYEIICWARDDKLITGDVISAEESTKSVICKTEGKCHFKYGIKQDIEVKQKKLTDGTDSTKF